MPHVLDDDQAAFAAGLVALYPALYNAVAAVHGFPPLSADERERVESLADRLSTPNRSVAAHADALRRTYER